MMLEAVHFVTRQYGAGSVSEELEGSAQAGGEQAG